MEGTLAGIVGSVLFAYIALQINMLHDVKEVIITIFAAFVATTAESYVGATFQDKVPWLTNELVNLFNTALGAIIAAICFSVFKGVPHNSIDIVQYIV